MPDELKDFREFVERAQHGSDVATRELFEQFGPHIIRVVRRKLDKKLRPKFDSNSCLSIACRLDERGKALANAVSY